MVEQEIWRIRTYQELCELHKDVDITVDIKKKRQGWKHQIRMARGKIVKKIFQVKPEKRKRIGRPSMRWLEYAEEDLWETKVKRW